MKLLVKLGGTLLDEAASRIRIARELADLRASGAELVVVHGGGKQMTRYLAERGVESRFVGGLRVTTPEVIDGVLKVFAGTVNHELVAALGAAGAAAVGLTGIDAWLTEAETLRADLGAVGRPTRTNPVLLWLLCANGYLPVIAGVAGDRKGAIYTVNADQMAVSCASAFGAERLIFLTDVDGVRGADGAICRTLTPDACRHLITSGVATGGMQAKLDAASDALAAGIPEVIIAPGAAENAVRRLLSGEPLGTRLARGAEQHHA